MMGRFSSTTRTSCRPLRELAHAVRLERPDHVDLVHAQAERAAASRRRGRGRCSAWRTSLKALPLAMMPKRSFGLSIDVVVQPIGADVGERRRPLHFHQPRFLPPAGRRASGCARPPSRQLEVVRQHDAHAVRIDVSTERRDSTTSCTVFMPAHSPQ